MRLCLTQYSKKMTIQLYLLDKSIYHRLYDNRFEKNTNIFYRSIFLSTFLKFFFFFVNFLTPIKIERTRQFSTFGCYSFFFGGFRFFFKGQLISKCLFGVIVSTKIAKKYYKNFCPKSFYSFLGASWKLFCASWKLFCASCRLSY